MYLIAHLKRYLAGRFLADRDRPDRSRPNQATARTNAAEASAVMRKRRENRDDVAEYLEAQRGAGTP